MRTETRGGSVCRTAVFGYGALSYLYSSTESRPSHREPTTSCSAFRMCWWKVTGNPVALGLCAVIAVFWTVRILVDYSLFLPRRLARRRQIRSRARDADLAFLTHSSDLRRNYPVSYDGMSICHAGSKHRPSNIHAYKPSRPLIRFPPVPTMGYVRKKDEDKEPETVAPVCMTVHTRRVKDDHGRHRLVFYADDQSGDTAEWIDVRKNHVVIPKEML